MGRKNRIQPREILPDTRYADIVVTKFMNAIMYDGKKSVAEKIFYTALETVESKANEDGIKVFRKAMDNLKPMLEVKSRRVGGATYQVPIEVKPARRQSLATRWLIDASRSRPEQTMADRLATEILEAAQGRGGAMKRKDDVHRMAEANKAFAHFRW